LVFIFFSNSVVGQAVVERRFVRIETRRIETTELI